MRVNKERKKSDVLSILIAVEEYYVCDKWVCACMFVCVYVCVDVFVCVYVLPSTGILRDVSWL